MNAQSFGRTFGRMFNRIERLLAFLPQQPRKLLLIALMVAGLPFFLVAFLLFRAWLYRDVSLDERGEIFYPTNQTQQVIEELQSINRNLANLKDNNALNDGNELWEVNSCSVQGYSEQRCSVQRYADQLYSDQRYSYQAEED